MKREFHIVVAALGLAGASLTLASCGRADKHVAANRPAPRPGPSAAPQPAAALARVNASEAVWGLRAGLNVAALSCRGRGRQPVAGDYARLLTRHRAVLAAAYRQEQGRQGNAFDRQQTRVYNTPSPISRHRPGSARLPARRRSGPTVWIRSLSPAPPRACWGT